MGCDIHGFLEIKKDNKWQVFEAEIFVDDTFLTGRKYAIPFYYRSYGLFGFLANVRNYSCVPCISDLKGLPDDSEYLNIKLEKPEDYGYGYKDIAYTKKESIDKDWNYHSHTYLTLKELLEFDYDQEFVNKRKQDKPTVTIKEFLGESYFKKLELLKTLDNNPENVRLIIWFDN